MKEENCKLIKIVEELHEKGLLKPLVKAGYMSVNILRDIDIALYVSAKISAGSKKEATYRETAEIFKISRKQVINICNKILV